MKLASSQDASSGARLAHSTSHCVTNTTFLGKDLVSITTTGSVLIFPSSPTNGRLVCVVEQHDYLYVSLTDLHETPDVS